MCKILQAELLKLKRNPTVWIGVVAALLAVLASRKIATANDGTLYDWALFTRNTIWLNTTLLFPCAITLVVGQSITRERTEDTLKSILIIPVSFRKLLTGKLLLGGAFTLVFALCEFVFSLLVFMTCRMPGLTIAGAIYSLVQMLGMNVCLYLAILPVITFTAFIPGAYFPGVAFAVFYGFLGIFAAGHDFTAFCPITAGLILIRYDGVERTNTGTLISAANLLLMFVITVAIAKLCGDRACQYEDEDTHK